MTEKKFADGISRRTVLASGASASVLLATGLGAGTAAAESFTGRGDNPRPTRPTIVLVHGAFADASSWNVRSSHVAMLSHPDRVAKLIVAAAGGR